MIKILLEAQEWHYSMNEQENSKRGVVCREGGKNLHFRRKWS